MYKNIIHKTKENRFVLIKDEQIAYLSYRLTDGVIDYNHTIVPKDQLILVFQS